MFAGYDWGGRAACVAAALWPQRCTGLVSVNGYLIQDISNAMTPIRPDLEAGLWYFYYFLTERGRAGLTANRRDIAKVIWTRNSPNWQFDEPTFQRAAAAFDNPDYVEVVLHSYRHRLGLAPGHPQYEQIETRLAAQPPITVPTITLDGLADGNFPATDGAGTAHSLHRASPAPPDTELGPQPATGKSERIRRGRVRTRTPANDRRALTGRPATCPQSGSAHTKPYIDIEGSELPGSAGAARPRCRLPG